MSLNLQENFRRERRRGGGGTFCDSVEVVQLKKLMAFQITVQIVRWPKRPCVLLQEMSFKINFDGAMFKERSSFGVGVFIQDDNW